MTAISKSTTKVHLQQIGPSTDQTSSPFALKSFIIEVPDTSDAAWTVSATLATYGITTLWGVHCWTHSTTDDVIIKESTEFVSAVSSGELTITLQGSTDNKKRVIEVWGI